MGQVEWRHSEKQGFLVGTLAVIGWTEEGGRKGFTALLKMENGHLDLLGHFLWLVNCTRMQPHETKMGSGHHSRGWPGRAACQVGGHVEINSWVVLWHTGALMADLINQDTGVKIRAGRKSQLVIE